MQEKQQIGSQQQVGMQQILENIPISTLPNTIEDGSNVLVIQKIVRAPFDLSMVFLSHEQHPDIFSNYQIKQHAQNYLNNFDETIKLYKLRFEKKFQETFNLQNSSLKEDEKEMVMYALSNLVGGIGYYHGDSFHQYGNGPVRTIPPYSLFYSLSLSILLPKRIFVG